MLGAIIGDIIGSRFKNKNIRNKDFELFTTDSEFTYATVQTIAVADSILSNRTYKDSLVLWGKKYRNQCSSQFLRWLDNPEPYGYYESEPLLRISPIPCARSFNFKRPLWAEVYDAVSCTHNSDAVTDYSQALADGILSALSGNKDGIEKQAYHINIDSIKSVDELQKSKNVPDSTCEGILPVVISCFRESTSFEDAIRNAISVGGDSITIACITGALAGAYFGIPQDIVNRLKDYLPNEMWKLTDTFVIKFNSLPVPFWADPATGKLPEEFNFIKTGTIFTR